MVLIEVARDGRPGLATLEPGDGQAVTRLFDRLSPESIYRRFFSPVQGPDRLRASLQRLGHHDREGMAAGGGGGGLAVAQWARPAGCREADLALVRGGDW